MSRLWLRRRLFAVRLVLVALVALALSAGLLPGGVGGVAGPGVAVAEEEPEEPPVPGQPLPPVPDPDEDEFVTEVPEVSWPASGVAEVAVTTGPARRAGVLPVLVRAVSGERAGRSPSRVVLCV